MILFVILCFTSAYENTICIYILNQYIKKAILFVVLHFKEAHKNTVLFVISHFKQAHKNIQFYS